MHSIGFLLRATDPEWKSTLKMPRYYVSLQTQGSVCCKWMSNHFSELKDHNYVCSAMCPECPTKVWRSRSCWLNSQESGPEIFQGLGGMTLSSTLLGPVLVWSQQNYLKLLLTVRYSKTSYRTAVPASLPRGNAGMKVNEMNNIYVI